jgi:NAD dependent epimerase/dehydratase family enzyme
MPWVHLEDVVEAISWCLRSDSVTGIINLTAPQPVTNAAFSRALGRALGRPAVVPVPALGLRMLYGEMAQTVITGQRVVPAVLERLGYEFRHPDVEQALRDALRR